MLKYIGLIAIAIIVLLFSVGFYLSPEFNVEQSVIIQAETDAIHPYVNDLKQWPKWTPWQELEPDTVIRYGNLTQGVGASQSWQGRSGSGRLHITASSPSNGIAYDTFFGDNTVPSISVIEYHRHDYGSTRLVWRMHGEVDMPLIGGVFALMVKSMTNDMYRKGLLKLKTLVEQAQ